MSRYLWSGFIALGLLLISGCGNSKKTAFTSECEWILVNAPDPSGCRLVAKFGSVRICQSLVPGELLSWGDTGWGADSTIGPNVSIWCTDPLRYKEVPTDDWRSSIAKVLEQTAVNDDLKYLIPPKLGDRRIWAGQTPGVLGLYFVNTRNTGVVTLVARDQQVGIQLLIEGADATEHANVLATALKGVQFEDEAVKGTGPNGT